MYYKEYGTTITGNQLYARVDDDGLIRLTCVSEYKEFQEWLAEGNEPLPADSE